MQSQTSSCSPTPLPQPRLQIALVCFATVLAVGNVAFHPVGQALGKAGSVFTAVWFGVFVAQAGLGAIWLALGNAKELFRLATAGAAYAAVAAMCFTGFFGWEGPNGVESANWSDLASSLLVLPMCIMSAAAPLWLLRVFAGWCIHHPSSPPSRLSIRQFSIGSLVLLTTLVALLLGIGQQVARLEAKEPLEFWTSMLIAFLAAMIASAATLIPAVTLLTRFPAIAGIVVIVLAVLYFVATSMLVALITAFGGKPPTTEELWGIYGIVSCPFLGYLFALFIPLSLLRWCGFRLTAERKLERNE